MINLPKIKLLHLADLHCDRKISHLNNEKSILRKTEILMTLKRTIETFSDADIVLISGDLIDNPDCSDATISFLTELFKEFSKIKFFIACGNHDYYESNSIQTLALKLPDNVIIFKDSIEEYTIEELGVRIFGISFSSAFSYTSLLNGFSCKDDEYINIMVMHGDVNSDSQYNPIAIQEIGQSGLDYLALGHVHDYHGIMKKSNTTYAYPGVMEPCGFDETGECGVIYGEIEKNSINLDFYPVSRREYHVIDFDVTEYSSSESLVMNLSKIISEDNLYRINLVGTKNCYFDSQYLAAAINGFYLEFNDCTETKNDILNYADEFSLRGKSADYLIKHKDEYTEDVYNKACEILSDLMCR